MLRIEQQGEGGRPVDRDLDRRYVPYLGLVGHRRYRPLERVEDPEADRQLVGYQRSAPSPRPERTDRGQRDHLRPQRQDRALRGQIIGGRPGRRRGEHPVAGEFGEHDAVAHRNFDHRGLPGFAQQRHFVEREGPRLLAADGGCQHDERRYREGFGTRQPLGQCVYPPVVHKEADRSAVHSEHRAQPLPVEHLVEGLEQKPVAAQRNDELGVFERDEAIAFTQVRLGSLGRLGIGCDQRRRYVQPFHHPRPATVKSCFRQRLSSM